MLANSQMRLGMIVAWHRHGAEEHGPHLRGGASPEHAHGVLHLLGSVIPPPSVHVKSNSSWDIRKSSPKTVVPRSTSGALNRMPSAVYTMWWPLPSTSMMCCMALQFLPPTLMTTRGRKQWLKGDDEDG